MLTLRTLVDELGLELLGRRGGADAAAALGPHHRADRPDAVAVGRRADPHHRPPARRARSASASSSRRLAGPRPRRGRASAPASTHDATARARWSTRPTALGFPLFEVPYELPFIAITEKAFTRLVNEQYEVLQRGIAIHKRLERLVLEERGLDELVRALSATIGGAVAGARLARRGDRLARVPAAPVRRGRRARARARSSARRRGRRRLEVGEFVPDHPELAGRSLVLPVSTRGRGAPAGVAAWPSGDARRARRLRAADPPAGGDRRRARADAPARDARHRAAPGRRRARRGAHRRAGRAARSPSRLRAVRRGRRARPCSCFAPPDPAAAELELDAPSARRRRRRAGRHPRRAAVRGGRRRRRRRPGRAGRGARRRRWAGRHGAGQGRGQPRRARGRAAAQLPRGALRARRSRPSPPTARRASPPTATSAPSSCCSRCRTTRRCALYCDSVLGPLENGGGEYGDELIRSLEAFIEQNGQWERAARELYCHRHTLRYRIRRVEELTGRDLRSARDRIEFWLALRARELRVREGRGAGRGRHHRAGDRARPGRVRGGERAAAARPRRGARARPSPRRTAGGKARAGARWTRASGLAARSTASTCS